MVDRTRKVFVNPTRGGGGGERERKSETAEKEAEELTNLCNKNFAHYYYYYWVVSGLGGDSLRGGYGAWEGN